MSAQARLLKIRQRIEHACEQSGRSRGEVSLLAVSKTFPASDIREFARLGQQAFGENYVQEAVAKITQLAESPEYPELQWHFIGPIQSNKTRDIAAHFDWVHSVDRLKIAKRLSDQRPEALGRLQILLQLNTSGEASKSGVEPVEVPELARQIAQLPNVQLRGVMTIPSQTEDEQALRDEFGQCMQAAEQLRQAGFDQIDTVSMGMSGDLELAIECGSTCVRVGSALFGERTRKTD